MNKQAAQAHNFATSPEGGFCGCLAGVEITPSLTKPFSGRRFLEVDGNRQPIPEVDGNQQSGLILSELPWSRPTPEEYRIELGRAEKTIREKRKIVKARARKLVPTLLFYAAAMLLFNSINVSSGLPALLLMLCVISIPFSSIALIVFWPSACDSGADWTSRWFPQPERALKGKLSDYGFDLKGGEDLENYLICLDSILPLIRKSGVPLTKQDALEIHNYFRRKHWRNNQIIDFADESGSAENNRSMTKGTIQLSW